MFGRKKLYKIKYKFVAIHETIISACNPHQAIKKLNKQVYYDIDILSIEEV
jgi:hypothetical protein